MVVSCFTLNRQCSSHVTAVLSLECDEKFNISRIFHTLLVPVFLNFSVLALGAGQELNLVPHLHGHYIPQMSSVCGKHVTLVTVLT